MIDVNVDSAFIKKSRNKTDIIETNLNKKSVFDQNNILTEDETKLLSKGLKFGIRDEKFNYFEILTGFEECAQNLSSIKINENLEIQNDMVDPQDSLMQNFQKLAY